MKYDSLIGDGPISVLEFRKRFADEADTQEMSEARVLVSLPHFLKSQATIQYRLAKSAPWSKGGFRPIARWYSSSFGRTPPPSAILEAVQAVRSTAQKPNEG